MLERIREKLRRGKYELLWIREHNTAQIIYQKCKSLSDYEVLEKISRTYSTKELMGYDYLGDTLISCGDYKPEEVYTLTIQECIELNLVIKKDLVNALRFEEYHNYKKEKRRRDRDVLGFSINVI